MAKKSNRRPRTLWYNVRINQDEKTVIEKLAEKSKAKTVSDYIRAAALNRPVEDRTVFREILNEQIRLNAAIKAAPAGPKKEQALADATAYIHLVLSQRDRHSS